MEIQEIQNENRKAALKLNKQAKKAMILNIILTLFVVSVLVFDIFMLVTHILNKEPIVTDCIIIGFVALCAIFDIYEVIISIKNYKEVHREYVYYKIISEYEN